MNGSGRNEASTSAAASLDQPAAERIRFRLPSEAFVLTAVLRTLIAAVLILLAIDFATIIDEANAPLPGESNRTAPLVMEPPEPKDHLRPYLPRAMPIRRSGKGPSMPGYPKEVPHEAVGAPMTFIRGPDGKASAVGRIELGVAPQLAVFLSSQGGEIRELHIHSPGGSVQDAIQMSKLLREQGIATVVPADGYCASSCPILFSGGVTRTVGARAWVGVHRVFAAAQQEGDLARGLADGQAVTAEIQDHLRSMGVDPLAWVHAMKTPSSKLYVFTPQELKTYRFVTVGG